jgi:uncharacterized membrane protein
VAALERLIVGHGGTAGLIVEVGAILAIVLLGLVVWVSNRRRDEPDD